MINRKNFSLFLLVFNLFAGIVSLQASSAPTKMTVPTAHIPYYTNTADTYINKPLHEKKLQDLQIDNVTLQRVSNALKGKTTLTPEELSLQAKCAKALLVIEERIAIKQPLEIVLAELARYNKNYTPDPGIVLPHIIELSEHLDYMDTEDTANIKLIGEKESFKNNYIAPKWDCNIINIENKKNKHADFLKIKKVDYKGQLEQFKNACEVIKQRLGTFPTPQSYPLSECKP